MISLMISLMMAVMPRLETPGPMRGAVVITVYVSGHHSHNHPSHYSASSFVSPLFANTSPYQSVQSVIESYFS